MSTRTVLVSAALLACCGVVSSQPQQLPPPVGLPTAPPGGGTTPALPTPGVVPPVTPRLDFSPPTPRPPVVPIPDGEIIPQVPVKASPTPEKTVDDLLTELERVQVEKAALDKKEQELKATVRKKLEQQAERLNKLGVAPKDMKTPDRVGRIVIEGNTKTPDEKILDKLDFRPGQVLQYPSLEAARAKLEKAGFKSVTVEAVPGELDATFKDIRVKVSEQP